MNNISFKSNIRTVPQNKFYEFINFIGISNAVNYPWTVHQSIFNTKAYTKNISDCTAVGITDGKDVFLMHLCPTRKENTNFTHISNYIKSKIHIMNKLYLQAFVIGSKDNIESKTLFDNLINLLKQLDIPTSYLKGGKSENHIAYNSNTDEWLISNPSIKPYTQSLQNLKAEFRDIKLSDLDTIV